LYNNNNNLTAWTVHDNLFDNVFYNWGSKSYTNSHNAYYNTPPLLGSLGSNVTVTNAPDYQVGTLGRYYLPTRARPLWRRASGLPVRAASCRPLEFGHFTLWLQKICRLRVQKPC